MVNLIDFWSKVMVILKLRKHFLILSLLSFLLLSSCMEMLEQNKFPQYQLFETKNMWTFIQLDTSSGLMWQIQFDVQGENRGAVVLSNQDLTNGGKKVPGRFTLYETQNIYTFILLDQTDGRSWQVQWSIESDKRGIMPIAQ